MISRYDQQVDRGAHNEMTFMRCARGFVLRSGTYASGEIGVVYAFDRIEDVGAWFVEQYSAQAIEAAEAGETTKVGSTEGKSAVAKGDAP